MIPGFVTSYRDILDYVHLFFFPGIDDNDVPIYNNIQLPENIECTSYVNDDGSVDYIFSNKTIYKIVCTLVKANSLDNKIVISLKVPKIKHKNN